MKNTLNILVVEDHANHLADCQAMFEELLPKFPIQVNVLWAKDLKEAFSLLPQADAVMTDVFFPAAPGGTDEEPSGQVVVSWCLDQSKPVVWVTSTHHHGKKTEPINQWGREHGLVLFDCQAEGASYYNDLEGQHKPWKEALYGLFYLILAFEGAHCVVSDGVLKNSKGSRLGGEPNCVASLYLQPDLFPRGGRTTSDDLVWPRMLELGFPRS
jgi:hypothetical protein